MKASHADVVVLGGTNVDYLVRGESLPTPGETVDGFEFLKAGGGKGANQAVAAARLGARVAFIGCVGRDDTGDEMLDLLRAESIDVRFVTRHRSAPTGVALIAVDRSAEKQIMVAPGANHRLKPGDVRGARPLISRARVLLTQFEVPMHSVLEATRIAATHGVPVVIDPAPFHAVPRELIRRAAIIRPNSAEAEGLTRIKVTDLASARRAARRLLEMGAGAAVVQAGDKGDLMVWNSGERLFPRLRIKAIDATGAGDAFAAGLAVAVSEGRSLCEAGAFANAAAAIATTKFGAQPAMPFRRNVLRLLRKSGHRAVARAFTQRPKAKKT